MKTLERRSEATMWMILFFAKQLIRSCSLTIPILTAITRARANLDPIRKEVPRRNMQ